MNDTGKAIEGCRIHRSSTRIASRLIAIAQGVVSTENQNTLALGVGHVAIRHLAICLEETIEGCKVARLGKADLIEQDHSRRGCVSLEEVTPFKHAVAILQGRGTGIVISRCLCVEVVTHVGSTCTGRELLCGLRLTRALFTSEERVLTCAL